MKEIDMITPYSEQEIPENLDFWGRVIKGGQALNLPKKTRNIIPEELRRFFNGIGWAD